MSSVDLLQLQPGMCFPAIIKLYVIKINCSLTYMNTINLGAYVLVLVFQNRTFLQYKPCRVLITRYCTTGLLCSSARQLSSYHSTNKATARVNCLTTLHSWTNLMPSASLFCITLWHHCRQKTAMWPTDRSSTHCSSHNLSFRAITLIVASCREVVDLAIDAMCHYCCCYSLERRWNSALRPAKLQVDGYDYSW